jgi:hypothetical protein
MVSQDIGVSPCHVTSGDFNRDGILDLAVAVNNSESGIFILPGNGDGTFGAGTFYATGARANSAVAGDFNRDGTLDLAVVNMDDNNVSILLQKGAAGNCRKGGGGGCFIATAAFGTPLAKQIGILREFRDRYLLTNVMGRRFVTWYYKNGPAAAGYIQSRPALKSIVRAALYPLIVFSFLLIKGILPYLLLFSCGGILLFRRKREKLIG